ncbi:MAG TPA: dihydrodipicolinate synthase family protein [Candidatus Binatia bacterium]|jgi:4-hydroxy-tetrahydrodipicolinate synthase
MEFKGIYAANITPFEPDGKEIRADELERLFLELKRAGVTGMVCNGHAGEGELLNRKEKRDVVKLARQTLGTDYPVVAGVHALPTWELIEQVEDAKEAGASAVMLCAPPLFAWHADRHPDFGIAQIRAVAETVPDMPIVLFQYSPNNPFYYRPEVLARICREIPQVQAIKMATNVDVAQYEEEVRAVRAVPRKIFLLPANGRTLYYAFQLLPDGALSGSANFCPAHDVEMFEAVKRGDLKRAKQLHDEIFPIFRLVYRDPYVFLHIRYKYCAWLLGKISSPALRSPLVPLPADEVNALRDGLRAARLEPVA